MCTRLASVVIAATLVAGVAHAAKIEMVHDQSVNFSQVRTFAWHEAEDTSGGQRDPIAHDRIVEMIKTHFRDNGLREVDVDPDVYITYHSITEMQQQTGAAGPIEGWYWRGGGIGVTTTDDLEYSVGTLMVDMFDPVERRMIWRGTAEKILPEDPLEGYRKADKAIAKMARKWRQLSRRTD